MPTEPTTPPILPKKRRWKVRSSALTPNTTIGCDLFDDLGELLVAAGQVITQSIIDDLKARQLNWLLIDADVDTSLLPIAQQTRPYSPPSMRLLAHTFAQCEETLEACVRLLAAGEQVDVEPLESLLALFAYEAEADIAAVLSSVVHTEMHDIDVYHQLIRRSVMMAALSTCVGVTMELTPIQLRTMGIAALFSDVPLMAPDSVQDIAKAQGQISAARNFLQHTVQSSQMTDKLKRISPLARMLINQVHEELDGSGFPYGISAWRIHPLARILNFTEAYLTLCHPLPGQLGVLPADALTCLICHGRSGRFCQRVTDAFVKSMSVYPVGSEVLLDNGLRATVLRACPDEQYRPAIMINDQKSRIIDLRCCPYQITTPIAPQECVNLGRLRVSKLNEPVWRLAPNEYVDMISTHV